MTRLLIPTASVHELSVSRGRRSGFAGALRGGSLGLLGGAVTGVVIGFVAGDAIAPGFAVRF